MFRLLLLLLLFLLAPGVSLAISVCEARLLLQKYPGPRSEKVRTLALPVEKLPDGRFKIIQVQMHQSGHFMSYTFFPKTVHNQCWFTGDILELYKTLPSSVLMPDDLVKEYAEKNPFDFGKMIFETMVGNISDLVIQSYRGENNWSWRVLTGVHKSVIDYMDDTTFFVVQDLRTTRVVGTLRFVSKVFLGTEPGPKDHTPMIDYLDLKNLKVSTDGILLEEVEGGQIGEVGMYMISSQIRGIEKAKVFSMLWHKLYQNIVLFPRIYLGNVNPSVVTGYNIGFYSDREHIDKFDEYAPSEIWHSSVEKDGIEWHVRRFDLKILHTLYNKLNNVFDY